MGPGFPTYHLVGEITYPHLPTHMPKIIDGNYNQIYNMSYISIDLNAVILSKLNKEGKKLTTRLSCMWCVKRSKGIEILPTEQWTEVAKGYGLVSRRDLGIVMKGC